MCCLHPNWPAPLHIKAFTTMRKGGLSKPPFNGFNLGYHVNDDSLAVKANRALLQTQLPGPAVWLEQVHSSRVINISKNTDINKLEPADALYTQELNTPLAIMTADCLPVLLTDKQGSQIAAVHGGWRGLAGGIIENTLACFSGDREDIIAWLGPAIGPTHFEVGQDVVAAFSGLNIDHLSAFEPLQKPAQNRPQKYHANIFLIAKLLLKQSGVKQVFSQRLCTFSDPDSFFSYRRESHTGRMASIICLAD